MRPGVRRSGLALAGLALGVLWIAATGWLDREAETGRTLAVAAPEHGQTVRAGAQAYLDVRAEARGLGAGCVLTATDHVDTWRRPIGKAAGARELTERFGPLRGHGERLAWLDLECPEGPPTAQPRARRVSLGAPPAPRAEVLRFHVRIASVQSWISRKLGPEIEEVVENLSGMTKTDERNGWIKFRKIVVDDVRLYARRSSGLALAANLQTTMDFRKYGEEDDTWVKGWIWAAGRVTLPFEITGFDRKRGWTVETEDVLWSGKLEVEDVECDDPSWLDRRLCDLYGIITAGGVTRAVRRKAREYLESELSCEEEGCIRELASARIEHEIEEFVDRKIEEAGPFVAGLLGDKSLLGNFSGLAKEMELGLSRVTTTDRGRGLDASVSVDSDWLGADTPRLYTPRRARSNEGSLVVSFVALNRMLARFTDRPFCTKVAPELQGLGVLGLDRGTKSDDVCGSFAAELLGGEGTLLRWTGLVYDPNFALPLRVRPLGRQNIELYVADARPFAPVGHTAMGVFARLERRLARRYGTTTWALGASGTPGNTLHVVLEAMSAGTGAVSERVRARYDSLAQLIDPRPGAATHAWLDVARARDRRALGERIARFATFSIKEQDLKLGNLRFVHPQITFLPELNAVHASGDIAIEE